MTMKLPEYFTERKRMIDEGYPLKVFNGSQVDDQYQRDRARIIHSASFRRLQSKTQVLNIGESDFYRTRLTHSLEVSQIGSSICERLRNDEELADFHGMIPSSSLIEAICLGHDLGHPPFGHGGEVALNGFMKEYGGFEGNGQTLRIAAILGEYSPNNGLDLTRRTLLGLLKYPAIHATVSNYSNPTDSKPPKCIHDEESIMLDWILQPFSEGDKLIIQSIKEVPEKHRKTRFKAFDTSIMELADDIAYGVHDLEDAIALRLVNKDLWRACVVDKSADFSMAPIISEGESFYTPKLFSESGKDRKHAISKMVGYFVQNITITSKNEADSQFIKFNATMKPEAAACLECLKDFVLKQVIFTPQVKSLEFKGQHIISKLYSTLSSHPKDLLPANTYATYLSSEKKERVICDFIAGMTDVYATRLYRRLFVPDVGSIFDRF